MGLIDTVKELCTLEGISGRENAVRDYIVSRLDGKCEYRIDPLGNILCEKKGKNPAKNRVMLDAHMDEVGLIITYICDDGLLKFATVGGINDKVIVGRTVKIGDIYGVIGIVPIHLTDKDKELEIPHAEDMYIDIGATSRDEAMTSVKPGDVACFCSDFVFFGDGCIKSRALDDRAGCAMLLEILTGDVENDVFASFSVQEEIGTRGAQAAAFTLAPDYAVCVESTTASDIPGVDGEKQVCLLNGGGVVSFMDRSTIYNKDLFDRAFELASDKNIKIQTKTKVAGGNDAGAIHKSRGGVKVLTVSVPCRYIHSPSCVATVKDIESSYELVKALIEEFANA